MWIAVFTSLLCLHASGQAPQWQDLHKVKRGETLFGIAKEYNVTIQQIIDANPEMKKEGYELQKGAWIAVPFGKKGDKRRGTPSSQTAPQAAKGSVAAQGPVSAQRPAAPATKKKDGTIRVGVMLPLHNDDGDGRRMVEYYRGLLLAFNQMKAEGINTDVHAWNVAKDADIRTTLLDANAASLDIIFGPLYTPQVKPLADFCRRNQIALVIPFSHREPGGGEQSPGLPSLSDRLVAQRDGGQLLPGALSEQPPSDLHRLQRPDIARGKIHPHAETAARRGQDSLRTDQHQLVYGRLCQAFSSKQPNAVVLNTEKSPQLTHVFHKLDSLTATRPGLAISMYGYNDWFIYQDYDLNWFFKYNTYIPSTFFYNKQSDKTSALEKLYQETYGAAMDKNYIPRLALTGYDHGEYFVRGLRQYGAAFKGLEKQPTKYKALQTRLRFLPIQGGGQQNRQFQLIHFKPDQTMESLTY